MPETVVIATWPFGRVAADAALSLLAAGRPALDAVIAGAQAVEDDPDVRSVGFGSLPDRVGRLTLDAAVMDGTTLRCGAVAGVEHVRHAAALARRVMEKTPHVLLVGDGAKWFALQQGFPLEMPYTESAIREWIAKRTENPSVAPTGPDDIYLIDESNHDTVTVLGRDSSGHLGGACTTSGLAFKLPGRVGDSPVIGAGLYVDDEAGAAGATGVGEEVIRVGGSLFAVERMRAGDSPQQACEAACRRVIAAARRRGAAPGHVAFIALSPDGRTGSACTAGTGFRYAVGRAGTVELLAAQEVA